jgi:hypothetical protein
MTAGIPPQIKVASAGLDKELKELFALLDVDAKTFFAKVRQDTKPYADAFGTDFVHAFTAALGCVCHIAEDIEEFLL